MNKKIIIGVFVVLIVLVCLFAFTKKEEKKTIPITDDTKVNEPIRVNGYTREEYAQMGTNKADLDLMFL
jgi:hypothetical protein